MTKPLYKGADLLQSPRIILLSNRISKRPAWGVPYEAFDEEDALKAIGLASKIVDCIRAILEQ